MGKNNHLTDADFQAAVDAEALYPNQTEAAKALGINRKTYLNRLERAHEQQFVAKSPEYHSRAITRARKVARPKSGIRRLIVTSVQDGTHIHMPFWRNLQAYAAALEAEIVVGGFTYGHALFTDHSAAHGAFHHEVVPYLSTSRIHVADKVAICCETNIIPTAVRPLSGFKTYTAELDGIFPHTKIAMESVAQPQSMGAKINVTTGTVSLPNYIPMKSGMRAQFHHVYGALLIEADSKGRIWMRHLLGDEEDGSFYDLDTRVDQGKITTGYRVKALVYGDIHYERADPAVLRAMFGYDMETCRQVSDDGLIDALRPEFQFFHDVADFTYRNHHSRNDHHFRFERWIKGEEDVEASLRGVSRFLEATRRKDAVSVVVSSNHHDAYLKWLKEPDVYARDPVNARFFLESQLAVYDAIQRDDRRFNIFEWALRRLSSDGLEGVRFPHEDESFMVGGIECGMHGHLGGNGARGSPMGIANLGPKSNINHFHSPGIIDGTYIAGVCNLDLGYNRGPSSWAVANTITYPNSKRTILFVNDGKWRA